MKIKARHTDKWQEAWTNFAIYVVWPKRVSWNRDPARDRVGIFCLLSIYVKKKKTAGMVSNKAC